jgi:hypothetical protein
MKTWSVDCPLFVGVSGEWATHARFVDIGNEVAIFTVRLPPARSEVFRKINMRMRFKDTAIIAKGRPAADCQIYGWQAGQSANERVIRCAKQALWPMKSGQKKEPPLTSPEV